LPASLGCIPSYPSRKTARLFLPFVIPCWNYHLQNWQSCDDLPKICNTNDVFEHERLKNENFMYKPWDIILLLSYDDPTFAILIGDVIFLSHLR